MARNQQIQNFLDALDGADSITISEDVSDSLIVDNLTVPAGEVMFVPSGEEIGVMDLVVEDTATIVVDGYVEVFGDLTSTGTISGTGEVTDRAL